MHFAQQIVMMWWWSSLVEALSCKWFWPIILDCRTKWPSWWKQTKDIRLTFRVNNVSKMVEKKERGVKIVSSRIRYQMKMKNVIFIFETKKILNNCWLSSSHYHQATPRKLMIKYHVIIFWGSHNALILSDISRSDAFHMPWWWIIWNIFHSFLIRMLI